MKPRYVLRAVSSWRQSMAYCLRSQAGSRAELAAWLLDLNGTESIKWSGYIDCVVGNAQETVGYLVARACAIKLRLAGVKVSSP